MILASLILASADSRFWGFQNQRSENRRSENQQPSLRGAQEGAARIVATGTRGWSPTYFTVTVWFNLLNPVSASQTPVLANLIAYSIRVANAAC